MLLRSARFTLPVSLALGSLLTFLVVLPLLANTLTVVNTNDSGPGSLRQALLDASSGDTIEFSNALYGQTITLTSGELVIPNNLTINGPGANLLAISGNNSSRVFNIQATVIISGVTIKDGAIDDIDIIINGGGIYNNGDLTVINSTISGNRHNQRRTGYNGGGGIYNNGSLTVTGSTVASNSAVFNGGGIYNVPSGSVFVTDSTFYGNSASVGGGIRNQGSSTLDRVLIVNNTATTDAHGVGGGIYNFGNLTVINSTISGNTALAGDGGGILHSTGVISVTNSTVSGNSASFGGGISNNGSMTIDNSTVSGNSAEIFVEFGGGGIYNNGDLAVINSTVSGNSTNNVGGGIFNFRTLNLTHLTVVSNSAKTEGGGLFNINDFYTSKTSMTNTILAANRVGATANDCFLASGILNSGGYNLVQAPDVSCLFIATGDVTGTAPLLDILGDNGGDTLTHALLSGSPAIDAVPLTQCALTTDQRGSPRPQGPDCDIGAYESSGFPNLSLTKAVDDNIPEPGQRITYTLIVSNSGVGNATSALISDTLPTGLTFAGLVTLDPPSAAMIGPPPTLVSGLTIPSGQSVTVTFPVTVSLGLSSGTIITNTATVTSVEVSTPVTGGVVITIAAVPAITVTKTANVSTAQANQAITYTYWITNIGNLNLTGIIANDDKLGNVPLGLTTLSQDQATSGTLAYTVTPDDLPGPLTNTVAVTGTSPGGPNVIAAANETIALERFNIFLPTVLKN